MSLQDTCHCCEPGAPPTPLAIDNRPGLSAIVFRAGTFASFRQAMLLEIAHFPELRDLSTRLSDDYTITVMELWAIVADVLTFYQERIANESYLRTARHRDSLLRLVRLLDYHLGPGVAAVALMAFTVEKNRSVNIPTGLRIQSVPAQDQKPQKYETVEAITATPFWNKVRVLPPPVAVNPLAKGSTKALLQPGPAGLAIAQTLALDTRLIVFRTEPFATPTPATEKLTVQQVKYEEERIRLLWKEPLNATWDNRTRVSAYARQFRLFGHNAPLQYMNPTATANSVAWKLVSRPAADFNVSTSLLHLDAKYDNLRPGSRLLAVTGSAVPIVLAVTAVDQVSHSFAPLTDTVTRITVNTTLTADLRGVILYELTGPEVFFWGLDYPERLQAAIVHIPGRRTGSTSLETGRTVSRKGFTPGAGIALEEINAGRRAILADAAQRHAAGTIAKATLYGADIHFLPTSADPTSVRELGFAADQATPITGLAGAADLNTPTLTNANREVAVTLGGKTRHLKIGATGATRDSVAAALQTALRAADADTLFAQAHVANILHRFVVLPGVAGATVAVNTTANDATTALELGFDPEKSRAVTGVSSAPIPAAPTLSNPAKEIGVVIGPFGPRRFTVPVSSFLSRAQAASKLQIGLNASDPAPLFAQAYAQALDDRIIVFPGVFGDEIQEWLRLELKLDANSALDPATAVLYGNVAQATHGETTANEILGDGDAAETFQKFLLRKKPLTYLAAANETGAASTLQVLVNRALWKEVPSFYHAGPRDNVFTTRLADDGTVTVQFGDGKNGARLPSGRANIAATYRQGTGLEGRVSAQKLTTLLDLPVGLKAGTNPLAAEGGADPETLDRARQNAPATVKTFGRAVSLQDFADLAAARPDIAKAYATWVWDHESRAVHLTVAGEAAGIFSKEQLRLIHAGLDQARDTNHKLRIDNFLRVPLVLTATIDVAADRLAKDVQAAVTQAVLAHLAFENVSFGAPVHLSDLYAVIQSVDGVVAADIDLFHFKDRSPAQLAYRGATADPVQRRLVIYGARPGTPPHVTPAEQAAIEHPDDVLIVTRGGINA